MLSPGRIVSGACCLRGQIVSGAGCLRGRLSLGHNVFGAYCLRGGLSRGILSPGHIVSGADCLGAHCLGADCLGADCLGAPCPSTPLFNVGTKKIPKWVRISKYGEISQSEIPQEFIPQSHNKEDQIVTRQSGIYSLQQRKEFRKFFLIKDARDLVTEEIVYKMFPETAMNTLDDEIALSSFSIHNYVATCLQQVFLPWPLSLLHLLPDWLILSGLVII